MARLLRLNQLTEEWKLAVDNEDVAVMTGVEISYMPESLQEHLFSECYDMNIKLSLNDAKALKELHRQGGLDKNALSKFLIQKEKGQVKKRDYQSVKLPSEMLSRYFDESSSKKEMESVIEMALEQYFAGERG